MAVNYEERICPRRRMNGPGRHHKYHRQRDCRGGNPKRIAKNLKTENADQGAPEMSSE